MNDQKYFKSSAIGSSLLSNFIKSQDHALKEIKPTGFMEEGKIFEDLIEEEATGSDIFTDKYFASDVNLKPDSAGWKKLLPVFEDETPPTLEEIDSLYIYTKERELHKTHKKLHRALDQIKAHDCRRLIPAPTWEKLKAMLENFKLAEFEPPGSWSVNLFAMLRAKTTSFQQTHFWTSESGAKCRMKSDVEFFWEDEEGKHGLIGDLKATANFGAFIQNWRKNYIWQSRHYWEGFCKYCRENDIIPPQEIWYFIQESTAPYLLHSWALSPDRLQALTPKYEEKLLACQQWIDAGKPKKGFTRTKYVNEWGNPIKGGLKYEK